MRHKTYDLLSVPLRKLNFGRILRLKLILFTLNSAIFYREAYKSLNFVRQTYEFGSLK